MFVEQEGETQVSPLHESVSEPEALAEEEGDPLPLPLEDIIDQMPPGWFHTRLLLVCGAGFAANSMAVSLLSFVSVCASIDWGLSDSQNASLISVVFAGELFGSLWWGPLADLHGRRWVYLSGCCCVAVGGVSSGLASSFAWLLLFRGMVGVGIGGLYGAGGILVECLPSSIRGRYLMFLHAYWTLGAILVSLLAWLLLPYYGWRSLLFVTAVPVCLAALAAQMLLPESPRWLVRQGRLKEARQVVAAAAMLNETPLPAHISVMMAPRGSESEGVGDGAASAPAANGFLIVDFFRSNKTWITVPIITCWFCFGFCYFSTVLFVIKVFEKHSSTDDHFEGTNECDFDYGSIFLSAASELLGLLVATTVIDRWGRVPTQMTTFMCAAAGSFMLSLRSASELQLLLISMLARMSIIGANSSVATGTPELFPTKHRATGHAVVNSAARLGSFLSPYLVESRVLSNSTIGLTIALVNLVGMSAAFCLPETKGLALDKAISHTNPMRKIVILIDSVSKYLRNRFMHEKEDNNNISKHSGSLSERQGEEGVELSSGQMPSKR